MSAALPGLKDVMRSNAQSFLVSRSFENRFDPTRWNRGPSGCRFRPLLQCHIQQSNRSRKPKAGWYQHWCSKLANKQLICQLFSFLGSIVCAEWYAEPRLENGLVPTLCHLDECKLFSIRLPTTGGRIMLSWRDSDARSWAEYLWKWCWKVTVLFHYCECHRKYILAHLSGARPFGVPPWQCKRMTGAKAGDGEKNFISRRSCHRLKKATAERSERIRQVMPLISHLFECRRCAAHGRSGFCLLHYP